MGYREYVKEFLTTEKEVDYAMKSVTIDDTMLSAEQRDVSQYIAFWGARFAAAQRATSLAKSEYEHMYSLKRSILKDENPKMTAQQTTDRTNIDQQVINMRRDFIQAEALEKFLRYTLEAVKHKSEQLRSLGATSRLEAKQYI